MIRVLVAGGRAVVTRVVVVALLHVSRLRDRAHKCGIDLRVGTAGSDGVALKLSASVSGIALYISQYIPPLPLLPELPEEALLFGILEMCC